MNKINQSNIFIENKNLYLNSKIFINNIEFIK